MCSEEPAGMVTLPLTTKEWPKDLVTYVQGLSPLGGLRAALKSFFPLLEGQHVHSQIVLSVLILPTESQITASLSFHFCPLANHQHFC